MNKAPEFKVGDKATYVLWSDRYAGFVESIDNRGVVTFRQGKATLANPEDREFTPGGFCGHTEFRGGQKWVIEPDADGPVRKFTRRVRKNGEVVYKEVGQATKSPDLCLVQGHSHYYDYNF